MGFAAPYFVARTREGEDSSGRSIVDVGVVRSIVDVGVVELDDRGRDRTDIAVRIDLTEEGGLLEVLEFGLGDCPSFVLCDAIRRFMTTDFGFMSVTSPPMYELQALSCWGLH